MSTNLQDNTEGNRNATFTESGESQLKRQEQELKAQFFIRSKVGETPDYLFFTVSPVQQRMTPDTSIGAFKMKVRKDSQAAVLLSDPSFRLLEITYAGEIGPNKIPTVLSANENYAYDKGRVVKTGWAPLQGHLGFTNPGPVDVVTQAYTRDLEESTNRQAQGMLVNKIATTFAQLRSERQTHGFSDTNDYVLKGIATEETSLGDSIAEKKLDIMQNITSNLCPTEWDGLLSFSHLAVNTSDGVNNPNGHKAVVLLRDHFKPINGQSTNKLQTLDELKKLAPETADRNQWATQLYNQFGVLSDKDQMRLLTLTYSTGPDHPMTKLAVQANTAFNVQTALENEFLKPQSFIPTNAEQTGIIPPPATRSHKLIANLELSSLPAAKLDELRRLIRQDSPTTDNYKDQIIDGKHIWISNEFPEKLNEILSDGMFNSRSLPELVRSPQFITMLTYYDKEVHSAMVVLRNNTQLASSIPEKLHELDKDENTFANYQTAAQLIRNGSVQQITAFEDYFGAGKHVVQDPSSDFWSHSADSLELRNGKAFESAQSLYDFYAQQELQRNVAMRTSNEFLLDQIEANRPLAVPNPHYFDKCEDGRYVPNAHLRKLSIEMAQAGTVESFAQFVYMQNPTKARLERRNSLSNSILAKLPKEPYELNEATPAIYFCNKALNPIYQKIQAQKATALAQLEKESFDSPELKQMAINKLNQQIEDQVRPEIQAIRKNYTDFNPDATQLEEFLRHKYGDKLYNTVSLAISGKPTFEDLQVHTAGLKFYNTVECLKTIGLEHHAMAKTDTMRLNKQKFPNPNKLSPEFLGGVAILSAVAFGTLMTFINPDGRDIS